MNFLSHLYLAGDSEGLIIGNYIADSVKGNAFDKFPEEIQKGILLHRKIDAFTDSHDVVEQSKQRLREKYRKFSSVIVDIFYDHYLAANFSRYAGLELRPFVSNIYELVLSNKHLLPEKSARFTHYMLEHDILYAYSKLEGIEKVLRGMDSRTKFDSNMEKSVEDLKEFYDLFKNEFELFFPDLEQHVKGLIEEERY